MIEEIRKIPKVELHLHLDGSISLKMASMLSNLSIEEVKPKMIAKEKCASLAEYLTKFTFPISLMQTKENLRLIAEDLVKRLEKENVIYAEVRFAPMFHKTKGLTYEDIITSVLEGLKTSKVKTNLILCMMRGASFEDNNDTINAALKFLGKGVCALDLAGDEKKYPTYLYQELFIEINKYNIPFTIHAGEAGSALEVEKALEFGAKRIGHGIHAINQKDVYNNIIKNNILLEICPTSNIQTNATDMYKNHPIKRMYEDGIPLSINTDNSTVSNISLSEEYIKLYNTFGLNTKDFKKINKMAIEHAFISDEEKKELLEKLI